MHPSQRLRSIADNRLNGNRVVLCISGSIAATECVKLARELIRHGAEVVPVMTEAATRLVTPDAIRFACGIQPITELTGDVEHLTVFSEPKKTVVLVAPATANVISKISVAIADDALTTVCLNALGLGVPLLISPAMGKSMLANPFLARNMERLRRQGVMVLPTFIEEGEAKMIDSTTIVEHVARLLSRGLLKGRQVLVVGGASEEAIDDVRLVSSRSSGKTALEIASVAFEEKANVHLWCGRVTAEEPYFIKCTPFESVSGLIDRLKGRKFDIVIVPASLADFIPPRTKGKISSSRGGLRLDMRPAPKFIEEIRGKCRVLVAFKAEVGEDSQVIANATKRLKETGADIIVANNISEVGPDETRAHIITKEGVETYKGGKRGLAEAIVGKIVSIAV